VPNTASVAEAIVLDKTRAKWEAFMLDLYADAPESFQAQQVACTVRSASAIAQFSNRDQGEEYRGNGIRVLMRLVILGGSDAGISAAQRAREVRPEVEVTVLRGTHFQLQQLWSSVLNQWRDTGLALISSPDARWRGC